MHAQLMMGMRPNLNNASNRFSAPNNMQQRPQATMQQIRPPWPQSNNSGPLQQPPQQLPHPQQQQQQHSQPSSAPSMGPASSSLKAQQAKQRRELLAHAQSFLNPYKKQTSKMGEGETTPTGPAVITIQSVAKEEAEPANKEPADKVDKK